MPERVWENAKSISLLLLLPSLFADHHGEAAEGDIPGLAQLPGADHGALQLCEFGRQALSSPGRAHRELCLLPEGHKANATY